jgi:hypothetical protein
LHAQKSFQISTTMGGQPDVVWSPASSAFVVSNIYNGPLMKVQKYLPSGDSAGGSTDPVPTDNVNANVSGYLNEGYVAGSNGLFGVGYIDSAASRFWLTVLNGQGNQIGSSFDVVSSFTSQWVTLGGTSAGFVGFYDAYQTGGVGEVLVGVASDGGVSAPGPSDAGDAGAFPGFLFPGTKSAVYARAVNDDVGGFGGVGAAFLFDDGVDFAYVNPDGMTHIGMSTLISHTYAGGDYIHVNNTGGSFGVSLFSNTAHSTQLITSTCMP